MARYRCPVCDAPAASAWRVLSMGMWSTVRCRQCQAELGLSRTLLGVTVVAEAFAFFAGSWFALGVGGFPWMLPGGVLASAVVALVFLAQARLQLRSSKPI